MAGDVYINKFPEGLDKDSDPKIRKNTTYFDAHNVQLTGDGKYGSVQNLKGTTFIANILSSTTYQNVNVLSAYAVNTYVQLSGNIEDCVYIFYVKNVAGVYTFCIDVFRKLTGIIYNVYSKVVSYAEMDVCMDATIVRDSNVDTIYFTVFNSSIKPGRIRCILENASILSDRQIELFKRVPEGQAYISDILYNAKGDSVISDVHTINLNNLLQTDLSTYKYWEGNALLDNDIQVDDEFDVSIDWSINLGCSPETQVSATIDIWSPESNGSLSGFPKAIQIGSGFSETYSNSGTETISITTSPYNVDPIYLRVGTTLVSGSGYAFSRASIRISNIIQTAGGDSYLRGSFTEKTYQILQY